MHNKTRQVACAAAMSSLALISACGGGGGSNPPSPPPPPANTAPVFTTRSLSTNEESNASAQLTASDAENQALTFAIATQPQHGTATLTAAGALTYSPAANYFGSDTLTVTVTDSAGAQTTGTVNFTVANLYDPAAAQDDALRVSVTPGQPIVLDALANDSNPDGSVLTPIIVTQPPHGGTVAVDATTRAITFQPANDYRGPISFSYRVSDGTTDSGVATARAVIGEFEGVMFLSDYTTPGVTEVHLYDGFQIRRISDSPLNGSAVTSHSFSDDQSTLVYVVNDTDVERVYVKPLNGSAPATLRYTSASKQGQTGNRVFAYLNRDGSYMAVSDGWSGNAKLYFVVNTATGTFTQVAGSMPGLLDTRFTLFHPTEPTLVMLQGMTAGPLPRNVGTAAVTAFIGNAADMRTLTQIGRTYSTGEYGTAEGIYFGIDARYLYHGEYLVTTSPPVTNLLVYDRQTQIETALVHRAMAPERGLNGTAFSSPDYSRLCYAFYEPSTVAIDGPARFYVTDTSNPANPAATVAVSPVINDTTQCQFAADNRTVIYRHYTAGRISQRAYAVDSASPGTPALLAPAAEAASKQGAWQVAKSAMRIAIAYYDDNGSPSLSGQIGRYYTMPLDGSGSAFLFSDNLDASAGGSPFFASSADGGFILYQRLQGGRYALELLSTHALNLSLPLSAAGETVGVRQARWFRSYP
jgi:hypothetical protein